MNLRHTGISIIWSKLKNTLYRGFSQFQLLLTKNALCQIHSAQYEKHGLFRPAETLEIPIVEQSVKLMPGIATVDHLRLSLNYQKKWNWRRSGLNLQQGNVRRLSQIKKCIYRNWNSYKARQAGLCIFQLRTARSRSSIIVDKPHHSIHRHCHCLPISKLLNIQSLPTNRLTKRQSERSVIPSIVSGRDLEAIIGLYASSRRIC